MMYTPVIDYEAVEFLYNAIKNRKNKKANKENK